MKFYPEPTKLAPRAAPATVTTIIFTTEQATRLRPALATIAASARTPPSSGGRGGWRWRRSQGQNQGLRQSINFNYNWSHSASDNVNIFPQLGGKNASDSNSVQAGYTVGYHKLTKSSTPAGIAARAKRPTTSPADRYCHTTRHTWAGRRRVEPQPAQLWPAQRAAQHHLRD